MKRTSSGVGTVVATLAATITSNGFADVLHYRVVDLGEPDPHGCSCTARDLNIAGDVVGFFFGADGDYNGFLATDGAVFDVSPAGENRTQSLGVNDAGLVVGWTNHWPLQRAFLYDGLTITNLGTFGGPYSLASDINNSNQIVGYAYTPAPEQHKHATLWRNGDMIDLGTLGGEFSEARAINELGVIVGRSWNVDRDWRAVFWTTDVEGPFELPSFGPPDMPTDATAVNDAGDIVGEVTVEFDVFGPIHHAALWRDGEVIDLGLLPEAGEGVSWFEAPAMITTTAADINNAGVVVGNSFPPAMEPEERHGPFVYRDGTMTNLNDLLDESSEGWTIREAYAINEAGVIAATAHSGGAARHAVLLEPVDDALPADLNNDGAVDAADLAMLLGAWGPCEGCPADLNNDGVVNAADLAALLGGWG